MIATYDYPVEPTYCEGEHCDECNTCGSDGCATCEHRWADEDAVSLSIQRERDSERPMRMGL
jgi:predicted metal-binding protein